MLIIGICDEEAAVRILLNRYIDKLKGDLDEPVQLLSYSNGEKLLHNYQLEIDLLFLEIPFKELNGIEIAKRLRKIDQNVRIIILTTRMNHVLEAYEADASGYLLKPLSYERFYKEVSDVLSEKSSIWGHYLVEKNNSGIYKIYLKSIKYIETRDRRTVIHTEDGDIILMHDIYPTSVEAALRIADALSGRGFCFVTVEQLMALRGVTPQAGALYFSLPPED